jgi:hypothetical protein
VATSCWPFASWLYLVLLVQNAAALDRMVEAFARNSGCHGVIVPALLDELIDPHWARSGSGPAASVAPGEHGSRRNVLAGLNCLKLATSLRRGAQLAGTIDSQQAHPASPASRRRCCKEFRLATGNPITAWPDELC